MTQPLLGAVDEDGFIWSLPRQTFVKLYVATGDAAAAARDAKLPKDDDYNELLEHASVQSMIVDLNDQIYRRHLENADTVMSRYSNIAEGNVNDYLDYGPLIPGGMGTERINMADFKIKDLRKMPRHMQQRIKKFKVSHTQHGTNFDIELHDAMAANTQIAKILGLDSETADDARTIAEAIFEWQKELGGLDANWQGHAEDHSEDG